MILLPQLKSELETAIKVTGIVSTAFSGGKSIVEFYDRSSLARRRTKTLDSIDTCLKRIAVARKETEEGMVLEDYQRELANDLQKQQLDLVQLENIKILLDRRRTEDPDGVRKWLCLYKPEGFDGFLSQAWFYFLSGGAFVLVGMIIYGTALGHVSAGDTFQLNSPRNYVRRNYLLFLADVSSAEANG